MALFWRQTKQAEANNSRTESAADDEPTEENCAENCQHLQIAPYIPPRRIDGTVERILSAALSALIAVLLAWKFLLSDGSNNCDEREIYRKPHAVYFGPEEASDCEETRAGEVEVIPLEQKRTSAAPDDDSRVTKGNNAQKSLSDPTTNNKGENLLENCCDRSGDSTKFHPPLPSTSSTQRPLLTEKHSVAKEREIVAIPGPPSKTFTGQQDSVMITTEEASVDSDSSCEEQGTLPTYLDTISEEDTDDLISLSSGRSSSLKLPADTPAQIQAVRERLAKNQQEFDTNHNNLAAEAAERTKNGTYAPLANDDLVGLPLDGAISPDEAGSWNSSHSSSPPSSVKSDDGEDSLSDKESDERTLLAASDTTLKASASELDALLTPSVVDRIIETNDFLNESLTSQSQSDYYPLLAEPGEREDKRENKFENQPVFSNNLRKERVGSPTERFSKAYRDYFEKNSLSDSDASCRRMEQIDLSESMKKFAYYGAVYGDAHSSEFEEFRPKKQDSNSSRSSSLVSVEGVPSDVDLIGTQNGLPKKSSSPPQQPSQIPVPLRLKEKLSKNCLPTSSEESEASKSELEPQTFLQKTQTTPSVQAHTNSETGPTTGGLSIGTTAVSGKVDNYAAFTDLPAVGVPPNAEEEKSKFHSEPLVAQRPVYRTTTHLTESQNTRDEKKSQSFQSDHSKGAIFALGNKNQPKKSESRLINGTPDLTPTSLDIPEEEDIVIASATSRLVAGNNEERVLGEATANAVSKNPYVALARATATAASKLNQTTVPPDENQKVSVIVASTVTTTKKELASPKTKSSYHEPGLTFLSPSSFSNISDDSVFRSTEDTMYGSHLKPEPVPRYSVEKKVMSSSENLSMRTVTESVTYSRTTTESPNALQMMQQSTPQRAESPERKRPLLQQNQQVYYREEIPPTRPGAHSYSPSSRLENANNVKNMSKNIEETPTRSKTEMGYQPEPHRILPPSQWIQQQPVHRVVSPSHLSTENIQKMIEEPYYVRGKSRETLFSNTPATPSMTYMVDKAPERPPSRGAMGQQMESSVPLSQENVSLWSSLPENSANSKQNLMRWRNSMHLDEDEVLASLMNSTKEAEKEPSANQSMASVGRSQSPYSQSSTAAADSAVAKQRMYQRQLEDERMEIVRNSRRAKYRTKIEKARKDYISAPPTTGSASDLYKTPEDFQKKFQVSMDEIRRPPATLRGPLLEKFNSPYFNSKVDLTKLPPTAYARMPPSRYDKEYNEIVARAERLWAAYKNRISPPKENLYARSRAYSASYLETNVDTGEDRKVTAGEVKVEETDLEDVHRSGHSLHSLGAAQQQQEHQSRGRMREQAEAIRDREAAKHRARSVDYLMDRRARTEVEPPENQLQKILGEPSHQPPEEQEWRFRKSTEKLHVPDWYLNSDYCPGKFDLNRSYFERLSTHGAPTLPERPQSAIPYVLAERPGPAQQNFSNQQPKSYDPHSGLKQTQKAPPTYKPTQDPSNQSRYVSPWTYGGRFSGPHGAVQNQVKKVQENRMTTSQTSTNWNQKFVAPAPEPETKRQQDKSGLFIPSDFFDKYKEEIEELRKSRTSLLGPQSSALEHSSLSGQLPVAAVKPRPSGLPLDQSSSSMSSPSMKRYGAPNTSTASTGAPSRPSTIGLFPNEEEPFGQGMITTSTPRNSDLLPRKAPVPAPRSSFSSPPERQAPPAPPAPPPVQQNYYQQSNTVQTDVQTQSTQRHQGWTVSAPPPDWNVPRNRDSRVIEVTDTFFGAKKVSEVEGGRRLAGNVTLEEVLDSLLALPGQQRRLSTLDESSWSLNTSFTEVLPKTPTAPGGPSIYTQNYRLMEQCERSPERAEELLKREILWVQCGYCGRTKELSEARRRYVTCRHCYTYYCTRVCRRSGWERHKSFCTFARVNTTCKEIILKVREDPDAQWQMSRVARQGYASRGRGSVNFRFRAHPLAETYVNGGWNALSRHPGNYLYYYTVPDLVEGRKDPNLVALCRRYDPRAKFILSVSIVADIEECPETPPPERNTWRKPVSSPPQQAEPVQQVQEPVQRPASEMNGRVSDSLSDYYLSRSRSLPRRYQHQNGGVPDAKTVLKSVLRSMENIAPGEPVLDEKYGTYESPDSVFDRSDRYRHTVDASPQKPIHYNSSPMVYDGKLYLGHYDDDGTDV